MKAFFLILFIGSLFYSCSSEKNEKLELFSAEAFAYDLGDGWEVNVTFHVKGFTQQEDNSLYHSKLNYSIDLIKPSNDTLKNFYFNTEEDTFQEKAEDIELEAQFDLDSTYQKGKYSLLINVIDKLSNQTANVKRSFELSN